MRHLPLVDPELSALLDREAARQETTLELVASENFVPPAILEAQGSILTNKYAEGYPGRRYHGGCEHIDAIEALCIERAKALFGADHANLQPHSGVNANLAVYQAVLEPGDPIVAMSLKAGGHLSHGAKASLTGRAWRPTHYGVHRETERIDLDEVRDLVRRVRPKMLICGASAYPRRIDYEGFRAVADEFGCLLMTDMAHIAGLVAAKVLPSPVPTCDFVTSTTTKTLRGARGGFILCRGRFADAIDRAIFPGTQGGPILQNLAAKGTTFRLAGTRAFAEYAARTVANARVLAERLTERGWRIVTGGTDNHLVLADVRPKGTTGDAAEAVLESVGLLVNKNSIPFDPNPPVSPSGVRLGTAALSTRGFTPDAMARVADLIDGAVTRREDGTVLTAIREEVRDLARAFPLYLGFGEGEAL